MQHIVDEPVCFLFSKFFLVTLFKFLYEDVTNFNNDYKFELG